MTDDKFQKESYENYFSGLPEIKVEKAVLIKSSKIIKKFVTDMVNLNWTSHQIYTAKQDLKTLVKIRLPTKILDEFNVISDNYENMLITKAEGFNQKIDILHKFYSK